MVPFELVLLNYLRSYLHRSGNSDSFLVHQVYI